MRRNPQRRRHPLARRLHHLHGARPRGTSSNLVAVTDEAGNTIYEEASASSGLIEDEGGATVSGGTMVMGLQYNQAITAARYLCDTARLR